MLGNMEDTKDAKDQGLLSNSDADSQQKENWKLN